MAKASFSLPDGLLEQLDALGDATDDILDEALEAGGAVALETVKSELAAVVGHGTKTPSRSSGELLGSLGKSAVRVNRAGVRNVKIGFAEPRKDGKANALVANVIEYGKSGQPARPFLARAKRRCRQEVVAAMQRVWEARVKR